MNSLLKRVFLFLSFALLSISLVSAQGFTIDEFNVDIQIDNQGKVHVEENIVVTFQERKRGIYRTIPFIFNVDGKKHRTPISSISVSGEKVKVTRSRGNTQIRIGDPDVTIIGGKTYTIKYTVNDAYVARGKWQEFYWNITGNEWPTGMKHVSAKITLPSNATLSDEDLKVYTGKIGETSSKARIYQSNNRTIECTNSEPLEAGEGITVALKLPKDYIPGVPAFGQAQADEEAFTNPYWAGIPVALLGLIFFFRRKMKDRPFEQAEVHDIYYSPEGLTSAHVGAFIDHQTNNRDVISLISYWASEGYLSISRRDGNIRLKKLQDLPSDFPDYEHSFFNQIFANKDDVSLQAFEEKFYSKFGKIKSQLTKEIYSQNYYDANYNSIFKSWKWAVFCMVFVTIGIQLLVFKVSLIGGIGLIVVGVISLFLMALTSPLSEHGYTVHSKLVALEKFLKNPDEEKVDSLLREDPKYFERMLPFAIAFGIDKEWMKYFEKHYTTSPLWYHDYDRGGVTSFQNFSSDLQFKEVTSAFSSLPQSSGSGGGGFSGSSGGGFGGGGGGSW